MTSALRPLLLTLLCALALPVRAADPLVQTRQLLEWSGALALLEQVRPLAQRILEDELAQRPQPLDAQRRRELLQRFDAKPLQQALVERIAAQLPAERLAQTRELLSQPLPKRVRFFERALTQSGVEREWQQWREQTPAPTPERLALLRAIDTAARDSRLAAQLQTAIERAVRQRLGRADDGLRAEAVAERERHLQPFTEQYLLYAYRYLRDDELQQYAQLLRDDALQQLFDAVAEGIEAIGREPAP